MQESENSYYCAVLQKPLKGETLAPSTWTDADFQDELQQNVERLENSHKHPAGLVASLEQSVKSSLDRGEPVVIYGTGFVAFNLLDALSPDLQEQLFAKEDNLLLVNSDAAQEGYWFLLPNGQYCQVHYAGTALKNKELNHIIIAVQSPHFKAEITDYLKTIGCAYSHMLSLS